MGLFTLHMFLFGPTFYWQRLETVRLYGVKNTRPFVSVRTYVEKSCHKIALRINKTIEQTIYAYKAKQEKQDVNQACVVTYTGCMHVWKLLLLPEIENRFRGQRLFSSLFL